MASEDGVEIYKRFYPWPDRFRLGDPVLVKEVTGMRWPDFASALDEFDSSEPPDQVVLAGLIAVAFWQGNPQMSRDKARRALERIPMEEIEIVEGDEAPEDDAAPPAEAGGQPSATPSESNEPPGSSSDETSPNGSGNPLSPVTSQESDSQAA